MEPASHPGRPPIWRSSRLTQSSRVNYGNSDSIFPCNLASRLRSLGSFPGMLQPVIDVGDGVVERKKDFMAVVKQPRADDGVGRRDQHDGLAALPSIKNFHACTDAGPDEIDQD